MRRHVGRDDRTVALDGWWPFEIATGNLTRFLSVLEGNQRISPVAAGYGHSQGIISPLHAEAMALIQTIRITSQMGCSRVQLETDAIELKKAITSQEYDLSYLGHLFREIKALLDVAYDDVKISWCKTSCNDVAHYLAAQGALLGDNNQMVWIIDLPQNVIDFCAGNLSSKLV